MEERDYSIPTGMIQDVPKLEPLSEEFGSIKSNVNVSVLERIKPLLINYPRLALLMNEKIVIPANVFVPSNIDHITKEFNSSSEFFTEVVTFLNVLNLIDSLEYGGDGMGVVNKFVNSLRHTSVMISNASPSTMERAKSNSISARTSASINTILEQPSMFMSVITVYIYCLASHLHGIDTLLDESTEINVSIDGR